jgi:hypothetical protein
VRDHKLLCNQDSPTLRDSDIRVFQAASYSSSYVNILSVQDYGQRVQAWAIACLRTFKVRLTVFLRPIYRIFSYFMFSPERWLKCISKYRLSGGAALHTHPSSQPDYGPHVGLQRPDPSGDQPSNFSG